MKKLFLIILLLLFSFSAVASAYDIQQTSDGGYITISDTTLMKKDGNGNLQWSKNFSEIAAIQLNKKFDERGVGQLSFVQQTSDGGYMAIGSIRVLEDRGTGWESRANLLWLLKTDSNGNLLWNRTIYDVKVSEFGRTYYIGVIANSVQQTSDGGYIITGTSPGGNTKIRLIKTDANGNLQWNKTFGSGKHPEGANSVQQTSDGGYIIAGQAVPIIYNQVWLIKTDADGNEQWNKVISGSYYNEVANSIRQTPDGGYVVAGSITLLNMYKFIDWGEFNDEFWLIKTDASGNEQWNKTFGADMIVNAETSDAARFVLKTSDGGYLVAGTTSANGGAVLLVKTDSNGNMLWNKIFGGNNTYSFYSIQITSDNGFVLEGETKPFGSGIWLIKTDSNGNEQWNKILEDNSKLLQNQKNNKEVQVTQELNNETAKNVSVSNIQQGNSLDNTLLYIIIAAFAAVILILLFWVRTRKKNVYPAQPMQPANPAF